MLEAGIVLFCKSSSNCCGHSWKKQLPEFNQIWDWYWSDSSKSLIWPLLAISIIHPYHWSFLVISQTPASAGRCQALAWSTGRWGAVGFGEAPLCPRSTFQPPVLEYINNKIGAHFNTMPPFVKPCFNVSKNQQFWQPWLEQLGWYTIYIHTYMYVFQIISLEKNYLIKRPWLD